MNKNEQQDDKLHISKSVFQTSREMQEKAEEQARKRNEEIQRKYAEKQKKAREARDKRLEEERLELLRLKTGVITESETIHEEVPEEIHQTFWQKVGSFFYLNKWWLGMGAVFTAIAVFLVVSLATKPRPDMVVLLIGNNQALGEESHIDKYFESFTPDNNHNGKKLVSVYYIPYTGNERADFANSVPTKLSAELQSAESVIVIGNELIGEVVTPEEYLGDVMGDLNGRRGRVVNMEARAGGAQSVRCQVPLASMFGYATDLRSKTQGRASFTMQPDHYEKVPAGIAEEIKASRS